jgi:hypothetical protein
MPGVTPISDPTTWLKRPTPIDLGARCSAEPAAAKHGASRTHID